MKIGIIVAMKKELNLLRIGLENKKEFSCEGWDVCSGTFSGKEIWIIQCGIGKVNAALCTEMLVRNFKPDLVINSGVAGGADACIGVGHVLVADAVAYHDVWCGPETEWGAASGCDTLMLCDESVIEAARESYGDKDSYHEGLICSGDIFVSKVEEVNLIKSHFPQTLAVDMESGAIAQVCSKHDVPFAIIRVISDTPGQTDNIAQYSDFWESAPSTTFLLVTAIISRLKNEKTELDKIASFCINHLTLNPGVYESRVDEMDNGELVTTFDIRMTAPNRQPALSIGALHAMEHIVATLLRNDPGWKDRIVYWGPMGCCTGNYLIVKGRPDASEIRDLMAKVMGELMNWQDAVPGATPRDCGNYLLMSLPEARLAAKAYHAVLTNSDCPLKYPL